MTCSPAISQILASDAGVVAILGKLQGKPTVFPNHLPSGVVAYPVIVYQTNKSESLADSFAGPANKYLQKVSLRCLARSYDKACQLANAVGTALIGRTGAVNGIVLAGIFDDDAVETSDGLADTSDQCEVYENEVALEVYFRVA